MSRASMLYDALDEYLKSQGFTKYSLEMDDANRKVVTMNMKLHNKLKSCRLIMIVTDTDIQSMGICPINADSENFSDVVEFITRANYGLKVGKFEFDYSDGEVRYQACQSTKAGIPSQEDIERVVDMPVMMLERYGDGLVKNLMGFGDPEADIKAIED